MKKFFTDMIEDTISNNNINLMYMVFISLISYDNNRTKEDIKNNCELLIDLISALENYPDDFKLQDIKEKAIKYNKKYYNK